MTILTKVLEDDKTYDGKAAHGRAETGHPRLHGLGGHGPGGGVRVGCVSSLWEQGRCGDSGVVSVDVFRERLHGTLRAWVAAYADTVCTFMHELDSTMGLQQTARCTEAQ